MRKFLVALVIFGVGWYSAGVALEIDKAEAKTVMVKCVAKSKAVRYPHFNGTRERCFPPGFWLRVPYKFAIRIGTYPILLTWRGGT